MATPALPSPTAPLISCAVWKSSPSSSPTAPPCRHSRPGSRCCRPHLPLPRGPAMNADVAKVEKLLRQQAAIAGFGSFALRQSDLLTVLNEAARVCAAGLSVPFAKVCRYRPAENDLTIEAGHGWKAGVVGHTCRADRTSPQG